MLLYSRRLLHFVYIERLPLRQVFEWVRPLKMFGGVLFWSEKISCPIFSNENQSEFWGAIQILKPIDRFVKGTGVKQARIFRMPDELLLEIYAKFICLLFSCHKKDFVSKEEKERIEIYITSGTRDRRE